MGPRFRGDDRWPDDRWLCVSCIPDATQRERQRSGASLIRDRHRLKRSRVCSAPLRAAPRPGHALAGPIPVLSCFSADSESSTPGLTITHTHTPPRSRGAFSAPGVCTFASLTPNEGWAERRETFGRCAKHPLGVPSCVKDARERAYDAGRSPLGAPPWRFWASGPRFRLLGRPPPYNSGQLPSAPCSELLAARS
jgi:hypothetical protein